MHQLYEKKSARDIIKKQACEFTVGTRTIIFGKNVMWLLTVQINDFLLNPCVYIGHWQCIQACSTKIQLFYSI